MIKNKNKNWNMYFQPRKKPAAIHMNHGKLDTDKNNEWAFSWVSHWWMETSNLVGSLAGPLNQALVFSLPSTQNQNQSLENKQTTIGFDSNNQLYWLSLQSSSNIPMNKSIDFVQGTQPPLERWCTGVVVMVMGHTWPCGFSSDFNQLGPKAQLLKQNKQGI